MRTDAPRARAGTFESQIVRTSAGGAVRGLAVDSGYRSASRRDLRGKVGPDLISHVTDASRTTPGTGNPGCLMSSTR